MMTIRRLTTRSRHGQSRCTYGLTLALVLLVPSVASGAVIGYLDPIRSAGPSRLETDVFLRVTPDLIGGQLEWFGVDIINSSVNGLPLADFSIAEFTAIAPFDPWQAGEQFGARPNFESQVVLDSFASVEAVPFDLASTAAFQVGTISLDYSGLGLGQGDTIKIDIIGVPDGMGAMTTAVALREPGSGVTVTSSPDFSTVDGPGTRSFTISAVPEPNTLFTFVALSSGLILYRHRRRPDESVSDV